MANKVNFGLKNVHYAKLTETNGVISYGTPVKINGGVSLSMSQVGETGEFYADDVLYYATTSNQGYEGDLVVAMLPNSFYTDIFGMTINTKDALVESASDKQSNFALGFEIDGDKNGRRVWFLNCSATRPNTNANTKENGLSVDTITMSIKMMPRTDNLKTKVSMELGTGNATEFNGWFTNVYEG